ncbi:MAG: diguanylate cyclase [Angelakisella sp.]
MSGGKAARNNQFDYNQIAEENEILKIAFSHINVSVFVYDTSTKVLRFIDNKTPPFGLPTTINDPVNYIIDTNIVTPEYVKPLKQLFEQNRCGAEKVSATIKTQICQKKKEYQWYSVVLINCFDTEGVVTRVVGTMQDVTERVTAELRCSKEEQFRLAMMAENRRVYEINVTRDRFMFLETLRSNIDSDEWRPYTETMSIICKARVYREDWETFLKIATRNSLLTSFEGGKSEFHCEYRVVDEDGTLRWTASTTHLLKDPLSGDIKGFIYAKDIDSQKRQELLLRQQAERDPLTGMYNRAAAEKMIENILLESSADHLHGFLSIDIDDFKTANDTFGHVQGDYLLQQIASGFSNILRATDILARMGGDEFIVFLNDVRNISRVNSVAKRLCEYVHTLCLSEVDEIHFSISVGIATYPLNGTTFVELYKYSDAALYFAKQNGKNCASAVF